MAYFGTRKSVQFGRLLYRPLRSTVQLPNVAWMHTYERNLQGRRQHVWSDRHFSLHIMSIPVVLNRQTCRVATLPVAPQLRDFVVELLEVAMPAIL